MISTHDYRTIETEAVRLIRLLKQHKTVSRIDDDIIIHDTKTGDDDIVFVMKKDTLHDVLSRVIECLIQKGKDDSN